MFEKIKSSLFSKKKAKIEEYKRLSLEEKLLNNLFDFKEVYFVSVDPRSKANNREKNLPGKPRPDLVNRLKNRYSEFRSQYMENGLDIYDIHKEIKVEEIKSSGLLDEKYKSLIKINENNVTVSAYIERGSKNEPVFRDYKIESTSALILYRKGIAWRKDDYLAYKGSIREGKEYHNEIVAILMFSDDKIGAIINKKYTLL